MTVGKPSCQTGSIERKLANHEEGKERGVKPRAEIQNRGNRQREKTPVTLVRLCAPTDRSTKHLLPTLGRESNWLQ
jgi:hypothetical protein